MTYKISDGNAAETAVSLSEAASICEDWYDYLVDEGRIPDACSPNLDHSSLDALNSSIRAWENRIAEASGKTAFTGHGRYHVTAGDRMGLNLSVAGVDTTTSSPDWSSEVEEAARSGSDEKKLQLGIPPMYICRKWNEATTDAWINLHHELVKQDSELLLQLFGEFMQALHLDPLAEPAQHPKRLDRFDRGLLLVGVPFVL